MIKPLPTLLLALLVGCALAFSGCVEQPDYRSDAQIDDNDDKDDDDDDDIDDDDNVDDDDDDDIDVDDNNDDGNNDTDPDPDPEPDNTTVRVPLQHRADGAACDNARSDAFNPPPPDSPEDYVQCYGHEECQEGPNGRCVGNGHDGWYCTYDQCFDDEACGGFACECGGGFRSDHNICLQRGNCLTDSDCGNNFCSPSLGDCGFYSGTVGYYCHTPEDECTDDADCGGGDNYCAFDPNSNRWSCSNDHCAG